MALIGVKKKRVSKKNRASWRKHADIKDVEQFLEEQRQEERIGKFDNKEDHELFIVDTKKSRGITEKQKRKLNALKPPKHLVDLENVSKVADPLANRNKVKLKKNGRNLEEEIFNPQKPRDFQAVKDRMNYYKKNKKPKNAKIVKTDLWSDDKVGSELKEFNQDAISRELALHNLKDTGRILVKLHDSAHHKTSKNKAVELPHPGTSYNPSFEDHQALLKEVIEKEEKIIKQEKHLKRVTTNTFSKMTAEERDLDQQKQLTTGISSDDENEKQVNDDDDNNSSISAINLPVEDKRKSKKARRKQKEQKEISRALELKKEMRKQRTEFHRLRHLEKQVVKEEKKSNLLRKERKIKEKQKAFQPKRLSRVKYAEPELCVNNASDIAGNLRNIKPESNLLVERFNNLQKRNILPTSVNVGLRKRSKIKRFTRSSHK